MPDSWNAGEYGNKYATNRKSSTASWNPFGPHSFFFGLKLDYCAAESENQGMLEDAVVLYDLGGKAEAALTVLNRLLARVSY